MARARNIKPAIMANEALADLPPLTRLLFIYLWMLADREGRLEDRPKRIGAQALPYDRSADVECMLADLCRAGFIERYTVDGQAVIQVLAFAKHQSPHVREAASTLPAKGHPDAGTSRGSAQHQPKRCAAPERPSPGDAEPSSRPPDSLIPDSLIPDTGSSDSPGLALAVPGPAANAPAKPKAKALGTRLPDDWQLPRAWGEWALEEYPQWTQAKVRLEGEKFADHWHSKTGKDATKLDWFATWRGWCRNDLAHKDDLRGGARGSPPPTSPEAQADRLAEVQRLMSANRGEVVDV